MGKASEAADDVAMPLCATEVQLAGLARELHGALLIAEPLRMPERQVDEDAELQWNEALPLAVGRSTIRAVVPQVAMGDAADGGAREQRVSSAAGMTRMVIINVVCTGTTPTKPPETAAPDPTITPIKATFNQATFSTDYEISIANPFKNLIQVEWVGTNCGTQVPTGKSDPFAEQTLNPKMTWSHPHPPCDPNKEHGDAKISVLVYGPTYLYRCDYQGAETGNGPACVKQ